MVIAILLLLLLFLVGFVSTFFHFPPNKLLPYLQSFVPKKSSIISTKEVKEKEKEKEEEEEEKKKKKKKKKKSKSSYEKAELESVFATFDKNGDGFITKQELGDSLKNIGIFITDKDVGSMVEKLDTNGDGLIDIDEFFDIYESLGRRDVVGGGDDDREEEEEEREMRDAFGVFDGDGDGLISVEELGSVLLSLGFRQGKMIEECKEMIKKVDIDGDGMVNFDEFKKMMKGGKRLIEVS